MFKSHYNSKTKVWKGIDLPLLYHPKISIGRVIFNALERDCDKITQITYDDNKRLTSGEIKLYSIRIALNLQKNGLKMNDCVGIIARNSTYIGSAVFASLVIGCPVNPLDTTFTSDDIIHMFKLTRPKIIFCDSNMINKLRSALLELENDALIVSIGERVLGCHYIDDYIEEIIGERDFK